MSSRSPSPGRQFDVDEACKVFITNIDGNQHQDAVKDELTKLFKPFGEIMKLNVKKNKNGLYYFAFLEFSNGQESTVAIKELDQYEIFGKRMRV